MEESSPSFSDILSKLNLGSAAGGPKVTTQVQTGSQATNTINFNPSINVSSPGATSDLRSAQSPSDQGTKYGAQAETGDGRTGAASGLTLPGSGAMVDTAGLGASSGVSSLTSSPLLLLALAAGAAFLLFFPGGKGKAK